MPFVQCRRLVRNDALEEEALREATRRDPLLL
jgi:hypothetical protein